MNAQPTPAEHCSQVLIDRYDLERAYPEEPPVQTLAFAISENNGITYEDAIKGLVNEAIEFERHKHPPFTKPPTLVDAVADAIADRGKPDVAEYIRDTDPDDDLWNNYLGPMLDSLQEDYAKSLADSGEEDFAGYHLVPLSDNLVRIYWEGERTDVYRQDADPEHRFPACRMAARWFGNARQEEQEESDAS